MFGCPVNQSPRSHLPKDLLQFGLPETSHVVSCNLLACVWRRMPTVVPFVVPILETVAAHYELPPPGYLCEVDVDGHVLVLPQRKFFGSPACLGSVDAYEQAGLQDKCCWQGGWLSKESEAVGLPWARLDMCIRASSILCFLIKLKLLLDGYAAEVSKNADDYTWSKPCRGAASFAPLLLKGKVKEGACVVLLQLAARVAVSNLHKDAKKSSET